MSNPIKYNSIIKGSIDINNVPKEFIDLMISEQTKIRIKLIYFILTTIEQRDETRSISTICRELSNDKIIFEDVHLCLDAKTIRKYYYKYLHLYYQYIIKETK